MKNSVLIVILYLFIVLLAGGWGKDSSCHIWAIYVYAGVKGVVFKHFTLG